MFTFTTNETFIWSSIQVYSFNTVTKQTLIVGNYSLNSLQQIKEIKF